MKYQIQTRPRLTMEVYLVEYEDDDLDNEADETWLGVWDGDWPADEACSYNTVRQESFLYDTREEAEADDLAYVEYI